MRPVQRQLFETAYAAQQTALDRIVARLNGERVSVIRDSAQAKLVGAFEEHLYRVMTEPGLRTADPDQLAELFAGLEEASAAEVGDALDRRLYDLGAALPHPRMLSGLYRLTGAEQAPFLALADRLDRTTERTVAMSPRPEVQAMMARVARKAPRDFGPVLAAVSGVLNMIGASDPGAGLLDDPRVDQALLEAEGFDPRPFLRARSAMARGELTPASSVVRGRVRLAEGLPRMVSVGAENLEMGDIGARALAEGQVAVVVLNGDTAPEFGARAKAVVDVYDGQSFLALKAEDVRRAQTTFGARIPLVVMNSFETHAVSQAHIGAHDAFGLPGGVLSFRQSISLRLTRDGGLFFGEDGEASYHSVGRGDLFASLRQSGVIQRLIVDHGIRYLLVSDVDNAAATIDPVVLGYHIASGRSMTAEVSPSAPAGSRDRAQGAVPLMVDGELQLVEPFRLPADLSQGGLSHVSPNNWVFSAGRINRDLPSVRHARPVDIDGRPAYQLESFLSDATTLQEGGAPLFALNVLEVPGMDDPSGRFIAATTPADLDAHRDLIRRRLAAGWGLRDGSHR